MNIKLIYLIAINVIGVLIMYVDKRKARLHRWRIPESTLWLVALLFGSFGTTLGMILFHHKNRKPLFRYGFVGLCFIQGYLLSRFCLLP